MEGDFNITHEDIEKAQDEAARHEERESWRDVGSKNVDKDVVSKKVDKRPRTPESDGKGWTTTNKKRKVFEQIETTVCGEKKKNENRWKKVEHKDKEKTSGKEKASVRDSNVKRNDLNVKKRKLFEHLSRGHQKKS